MRKADIVVTCDICQHAQYNRVELDSGKLRHIYSEWFDGNEFLWVNVEDKDVCPRCRRNVAKAFILGIAEGRAARIDKRKERTMNDKVFFAALTKDIGDALENTFIKRSLIVPKTFVFEQAITVGKHTFGIRVLCTAETPDAPE